MANEITLDRHYWQTPVCCLCLSSAMEHTRLRVPRSCASILSLASWCCWPFAYLDTKLAASKPCAPLEKKKDVTEHSYFSSSVWCLIEPHLGFLDTEYHSISLTRKVSAILDAKVGCVYGN